MEMVKEKSSIRAGRGCCKKNNTNITATFIVKNDRGLHTRPSTELVKCTSRFKADIQMCYQDTQVNAKSLLGILMLAATKGSKIHLTATGEDAQEAIDAILELANSKFHIEY